MLSNFKIRPSISSLNSPLSLIGILALGFLSGVTGFFILHFFHIPQGSPWGSVGILLEIMPWIAMLVACWIFFDADEEQPTKLVNIKEQSVKAIVYPPGPFAKNWARLLREQNITFTVEEREGLDQNRPI